MSAPSNLLVLRRERLSQQLCRAEPAAAETSPGHAWRPRTQQQRAGFSDVTEWIWGRRPIDRPSSRREDR
eukprot:366106-Chlamydomonas_euryale.AAC.3